MATFKVEICRVAAIEPIANADAIELAVVGDYRSVVKKGQFKAGDLAVYIPEAAIVPTNILQLIGLEGKLAGKNKDRVKAVRLRGCLSQGICCDPYKELYGALLGTNAFFEGQDVTETLGIIKYEPAIPTSMAGEVYNAGQHLTVAYDIENYKRYPNIIQEGENVTFTEKLHGTFCGIGILPPVDRDEKHIRGKFVVFSKGQGAAGLCFKDNVNNASTNVYLKALIKLGMFDKLDHMNTTAHPIFFLGEVFGRGVQDLEYTEHLQFRVFDVCYGYRGDQHYFTDEYIQDVCERLGLTRVPVLYRGPFSKELMIQHTSGNETVSGQEKHMREGIVITPTEERIDPSIGRVILKSVSTEYILRNGGTEFA